MPLEPIDWIAPGYVRAWYGQIVNIDIQTEPRWCSTCDRYRTTYRDICIECGADT